MNRLALAEMRLRPGEDVLEIGFGGGALLALILAADPGSATGVDPSPAMVERCRRRFRGRPKLRLFEGSVEQLPLPSSSIDKACSVNNIYFWPSPVAALGELGRVVRPGGTCSICFEPPEELRKWPGHRFGFRLFDEVEVMELMGKAGFGGIRRAEGRGRKPDRFLCLTGERLTEDAAA